MCVFRSLQVAVILYCLSLGIFSGLVLAVLELRETRMMLAAPAPNQNTLCNVDDNLLVGKMELHLPSRINMNDKNSDIKPDGMKRKFQHLSGETSYPVPKLMDVLFKKEANPNFPLSVLYQKNKKEIGYEETDEGHSRINTRIKRQANLRSSLPSSPPNSCKDKCGRDTYLPCSCSKKCVVYKNCCEGFTEDCPNTARQGNEDYADFLEAQVICTDYDILVIASCRESSLLLNDTFTEHHDPNTLKELVNVKGPVFDLFTRLAFINQSIYQCNKYPASEGVICGSLKFIFKGQETIREIGNGSLSFEELSHSLMTDKMEYTFIPDLKSYPELNDCIHTAHRTCTEGFANPSEVKETKEKCEMLSSYIKCSDTGIIYANSYCMTCSVIFKDISQCEHVTNSSTERSEGGFSILVSFDNDDNNMVVDFKGSGSVPGRDWRKISCDMASEKACNVLNCPETSESSKFNMCTREAYTELDIYTKFQLEKSIVHSLHDLMKCSLEEMEGTISVANNQGPSQVHEVLHNDYHYHIKISYTFYTTQDLYFGKEQHNGTTLQMTALYNDVMRIYIWYADVASSGKLLDAGPVYGCFCAKFTSCISTCNSFHTYEVKDNNSRDLLKEYNGKCESTLSFNVVNDDDKVRPWKALGVIVGLGIIVIMA